MPVTPHLRLARAPGGAPARRGRGVAALTVVMILFFIMALVAAYTNRNLLFEQRISANGYRATRALEAADAGVEWTLAMLNGGRITASCGRAGAQNADDFRSRYLVPAADETFGEGAFSLPWGQTPANRVYPACIIVNGTTTCTCPALGGPVAAIAVPNDPNVPVSAFRITFRLFNDITPRGGAIQFVTRGCSNPGGGANNCIAQSDNPPDADSSTALITTVGLVRALPVAPKAVLTAGGDVNAGGSGLQVGNGDFASGLTVLAGGNIDAPVATSRFESAAGSGVGGRVEGDAALAALAGQGSEAWFRAQFALDTASYRRQPATVRVDCSAGGCNQATPDVVDRLALNPRNPIWVDGDLDLSGNGAVGSAADPVMLIVTGTLTVSGNVQVTGFVHADRIVWTAPATASWDGALVARRDVQVDTVATLRYSKPALDEIRLRYGSFVRAPGGWNLF